MTFAAHMSPFDQKRTLLLLGHKRRKLFCERP
jgi:hypothetical protein